MSNVIPLYWILKINQLYMSTASQIFQKSPDELIILEPPDIDFSQLFLLNQRPSLNNKY